MNNVKFDTFQQFESFEEDSYSVEDLENDLMFFVDTKRIADGADSLADLADMLRAYADLVESMHDDGFVLDEPILNGKGYAFLSDEV